MVHIGTRLAYLKAVSVPLFRLFEFSLKLYGSIWRETATMTTVTTTTPPLNQSSFE